MINLPNCVGFLGCGNMGGAILKGILQSKLLPDHKIIILEKAKNKEDQLQGNQINRVYNLHDLLEKCEMIFICVKPQDFRNISNQFKSYQGTKRTLVSIMAGFSVAQIQNLIGESFNVIRTMPNLPLLSQEGMTAIAKSPTLLIEIGQVFEFFNCCGKVIEVQEQDMDIVTALSGSGPAYVFQFLEAQIQSAVKQNLNVEVAQILVEQTLLGALKVLQSNHLSLSEWISKVCSKGGTTIAALEAMDRAGFTGSIQKGIESAMKRSREMTQ